MAFDAIAGQDTAVQTLKLALESGRLHHAYRFEGPDGVGKERTAFALPPCEIGKIARTGEVARGVLCRGGDE